MSNWVPFATGRVATFDASLSYKDTACTQVAMIGDTVAAVKGSAGEVFLVAGNGTAVLSLDESGGQAVDFEGSGLVNSSATIDAQDVFMAMAAQGSQTGSSTAFALSVGAHVASLVLGSQMGANNSGAATSGTFPGQVVISQTRDMCAYWLESTPALVTFGRGNEGLQTTASNVVTDSSPQTILGVCKDPTANGYEWHGKVSRGGFWTRSALTLAQRNQIITDIMTASGLPRVAGQGKAKFIVDGDSNGQCIATTSINNDTVASLTTSLQTGGFDTSKLVTENIATLSAVIGTSSDTLTNNSVFGRLSLMAASVNRDFAAGTGSVTVLLQVGENNASSETADVIAGQLSSYCAALRAALVNPGNIPFHIVLGTIPPRSDSGNGAGTTYETNRQRFNTVLAPAGIAGIDAFATIGTDAQLGPVTAPGQAVYYAPDLIHWTDAGAARAGALYYSAASPYITLGATVSGVTVSTVGNVSTTVVGGTTLSLAAVVAGTNNPSQSVTWAVTNLDGTTNNVPATITNQGVVTPAASITSGQQQFKAVATSVLDGTHSGSLTITIEQKDAAPTFSRTSGSTVNVGDTLTITGHGGTVHYTYGATGTTPTSASPTVTGPITFSAAGTVTIEAYEVLSGEADSAVAIATFTVVTPSSGSGPSAADIATAVWAAGSRSLTDKVGYALTDADHNAAAAALLDLAAGVESNMTLRQSVRVLLAVMAGNAAVNNSTVAFKRLTDGNETAITVTPDAFGNRSGSTVGNV